MLEKILTRDLNDLVKSKLNFEKLYELRIRANSPITVNYGGKYFYLTSNGISAMESEALIADSSLIETIVFNASNYSIYAVNYMLQHCYIACQGGVRIGVCGEVVIEDGKIITVKNFSQLNIRIPHQVKNCSLNAIKYMIDETGFKNTLIISPPGAGKTTFIRDVAYQLSNLNLAYNLLVLDERFEIAGAVNGQNMNDVGKFTDVISGAKKSFGFVEGIRSMRPDIIFCDEIADSDDVEAVRFAVNSGVKVVATTHAFNLNDFRNKKSFAELIEGQYFDRYIVLSSKEGPGTYEGIFDKKFACLYCR